MPFNKSFIPSSSFTELSRQLKSPPQVTLSGLRMGQMQQFHASAKNRRLAAQMANRPGVQAALGQKQLGTSVQNRLGNQNRLSVQGRLGRNKMTGLRTANRGGRQQTKIAPGRIGVKRGGFVSKRGGLSSVGRGRGNQNRLGRGAGRGMQVGRGGAKIRGGRGRGRGGARGRGRGGQNNPTKSKDDLDKELDDYMTHTKSHLDAELDQYMQGAGNDE